jgi:hypothetical protein
VIRILKIAYYALTAVALVTGTVVGYNQLRIWQHSGQSYMSELLRLILIFVFAGCFLGGGVAHFLAFRIRKALPQESGGDQWPSNQKLKRKFLWANGERIKLEAELKTRGELHHEEVRKLVVSHEADLSKAGVLRDQLTLEKQEALNKVSELEARLEMFTPLQLEAFKLANEIQAFYAELGPEPKYPSKLEDGTGDGIWDALAKHKQALLPYRTRLEHGFERRFAKRTTELVHEFAEKGIQNSSIRITSVKFPFLGVEEEKALPSNIRGLANQLADRLPLADGNGARPE